MTSIQNQYNNDIDEFSALIRLEVFLPRIPACGHSLPIPIRGGSIIQDTLNAPSE